MTFANIVLNTHNNSAYGNYFMPSFNFAFSAGNMFAKPFNYSFMNVIPQSYNYNNSSDALSRLYNILSTSSIKAPKQKNRHSSSYRASGNIGNDIVSTAKQYLGYRESDNSYKLFTGGRNEAWCADFVSYTVREAFAKNGQSAPSGFGSSSVEGLRQWGLNNGRYMSLNGTSTKSSAIAQNVKPGDVVIFKNGTSHTGIVSKVNSDGSFQTIEGNTSDKVAYRNYSATDGRISGFVQLA